MDVEFSEHFIIKSNYENSSKLNYKRRVWRYQ